MGRQQAYLEAATRVFSRYGVAKTTMGDIAAEAGVSRQALYGVFPTKDDLLAASIQHVSGQSMDEVQDRWSQHSDLGRKLDDLFELTIIHYYDMMQREPETKDIVGEGSAATQAALACVCLRKRDMIAEMLLP